jgi:MFS family permease
MNSRLFVNCILAAFISGIVSTLYAEFTGDRIGSAVVGLSGLALIMIGAAVIALIASRNSGAEYKYKTTFLASWIVIIGSILCFFGYVIFKVSPDSEELLTVFGVFLGVGTAAAAIIALFFTGKHKPPARHSHKDILDDI